MTYTFLIMMNLKIIIIFILMNQNSKKKMKIFAYNIYPNKPALQKENEDLCKASFLDLSIKVHDRKFTTSLMKE